MTGSTTIVGVTSEPIGAAAGAPVVYAPATFTPLAPTEQPGAGIQSRFTRGARSPIPELAVAVAVVAATVVLVRRALETASLGGSGGPGPTWWLTVTSMAIGDQFLDIRGATGSRVWLATAAIVVAMIAVIALIRRIGMNCRHNLFGAGLALAALPTWWLMPLVMPEGRRPDRTELIVRLMASLCVLLAQAVLARWVMTARAWRAADLPGVLGSLILWVPLLVANTWLVGSTLWTVIAVGDDGRGDSSWVPTDGVLRAQALVTRGTAVAFAVFLVVAVASQHADLARSRRPAAT